MSNVRVVGLPAVIGLRPVAPGINNRASGSVDEVFWGSISRWQDARSVAALHSRAERLQSLTVIYLSVKPRGAGGFSSASKLSLTPVAHDTVTRTHTPTHIYAHMPLTVSRPWSGCTLKKKLVAMSHCMCVCMHFVISISKKKNKERMTAKFSQENCGCKHRKKNIIKVNPFPV